MSALTLVFHAPYGLQQSFPGGAGSSGPGRTGNTFIATRRATVLSAEGAVVRIPVISANAMRARLRRAVARELERLAFPDGAATMNWQVAALLYAGGAQIKDVRAPDVLTAIADFLPVYLFGGNWFVDQIPGHLVATDLMMATTANPPALFRLPLAETFLADPERDARLVPVVGEADGHLVQTVALSSRLDEALDLDDARRPMDPRLVMDAETAEHLAVTASTRRAAEDGAGDARTGLIFEYQVAIGNTWWFGGLDVLGGADAPRTRQAQSLLRWAAETVYQGATVLGGKHNHGYGLAEGAVLLPEDWPDADLWRREWLPTVVDDLRTLLGPQSPWIATRIVKTSAAETKARAQKKQAERKAAQAADAEA